MYSAAGVSTESQPHARRRDSSVVCRTTLYQHHPDSHQGSRIKYDAKLAIPTNLSLQSIVTWSRPRSLYTIEYCVQPPSNDSMHVSKLQPRRVKACLPYRKTLVNRVTLQPSIVIIGDPGITQLGRLIHGSPSNSLLITIRLYRHSINVKGQRDRVAHIELLEIIETPL